MEFPRSVCLFVIAADDCDTHSVTALACKSLNLSQALHEKCLHLELSSSDEDDTLRNLQVPIQNFPPLLLNKKIIIYSVFLHITKKFS